MRSFVSAFRKARQCPHGIAGLEFALIAPLLVLVLLGIVDYGRAIDQSIRLETAARAGAQYAMSFPEDIPGIRTSVTNALIGQTHVETPQVTIFCECPLTGGGTTADAGCTSTCSNRRRMVSVTVRQTFTPFFFTHVNTLTGNVVLRLE